MDTLVADTQNTGEVIAVEHPSFSEFASAINNNFNNALVIADAKLFKTDIPKGKLFETFLASFPEQDHQYYNCSCCRSFLNRVGDLVYVDENDQLISALWETDGQGITNNYSSAFSQAVTNMREIVRMANITRMFYATCGYFGAQNKGGHDHFYIHVNDHTFRYIRNESNVQAIQYMSMLKKSLSVNIDTVQEVLKLFKYDSRFAGSGRAKTVLEIFIDYRTSYAQYKNIRTKTALLWRTLSWFNMNIINFTNTALGKLISDLAPFTFPIDHVSQADFNVQIANYFDRVSADKHMRPVAPPPIGQKERAETIVAKLGIAPSLLRRTATVDDILFTIWKPPVAKVPETNTAATGVFGVVKTKDQVEVIEGKPINGGVITLMRLINEVLPKATSMHVRMRNGSRYSFGMVATAVDPTAPPIMRWDLPEQRNPVSTFCWVYPLSPMLTGIDATKPVEVLGMMRHPVTWYGVEPVGANDTVSLIFSSNGKIDLPLEDSALFPVNMRKELYEVRQTIEAYSGATPIIQTPGQVVTLGIGVGSGTFNLPVEVMIDGDKVSYTVDRFQ